MKICYTIVEVKLNVAGAGLLSLKIIKTIY